MKQDNSLIWVVIAVAAFLLIGSFGFGWAGYGMMPMMYGSYGSGMMFFGWIFGVLILVALILFIMWLIKQLQPNKK